jgi:hypothetical protein
MRKTAIALALAAGMTATLSAQAALEARYLDNDTVPDAYYDTVLDITWQQDANLAVTNTFGLPYDTDLGDHPNDSYGPNYSEVISESRGRMTWGAALHWIDAMNAANYLGYSDWRLPQVRPINGTTSFIYNNSFAGDTDVGYNISAPGSTYPGATGSELAYMYYNNAGNMGFFDTSGAPQSGCCLWNDNPFSNLQYDILSPSYWSGTEYAPDTTSAWAFDPKFGGQGGWFKGDEPSSFAWAVRSGDVVAIPEPAWAVGSGDVFAIPEPETYALMLAGLGLVGWLARRRG